MVNYMGVVGRGIGGDVCGRKDPGGSDSDESEDGELKWKEKTQSSELLADPLPIPCYLQVWLTLCYDLTVSLWLDGY